MRAAIVGALVGSLATGAALAKQEPLKPERPTIEVKSKSVPLVSCEPVLVEWWVITANGQTKLAGRQIIRDSRCGSQR